MLSLNVYGSSSKGNCYVLSDEEYSIMIECGVKNISNKLDVSKIAGILVTHRHADHCRDAIKIKEYYNYKFYSNKETLDKLPVIEEQKREVNEGIPFEIGTFKIVPFSVFHDVENYGYLIKHIPSGMKILFITDTSSISNLQFKDIDIFIVEANNSITWLENKEEFDLKDYRTYGDSGHLSVEDTMEFVNMNANHNTKRLILTHISRSCNNYLEILDIAQKLNEHKDIIITAIDPHLKEPLTIMLKEDLIDFDFS